MPSILQMLLLLLLSFLVQNIVEEVKVGCFSLICDVAVCSLCLFLVVPWVGLLSVIMAFPGHTMISE